MLKIDPEFKSLCPPLTTEESQLLEESLKRYGCLSPLMTWSNGTSQFLIDGHHRYEICERLEISYQLERITADSRKEVVNWIIRNQLGRRNLTPEQASYLRGKQYNLEKKKMGAPAGNQNAEKQSIQNDHFVSKTHERLAKEYKVSPSTIQRDGQFTASVDTIEQLYGTETKDVILSGESQKITDDGRKMTKQEIINLSTLPALKGEDGRIRFKRNKKKDRDRKTPKLAHEYNVDIRRGDFREVLSDIEPQSVKLILTDPPYGKKYLNLWSDLGRFAAKTLQPDGALITYSGQLYLPKVISILNEHLNYWWTCGVAHKGSGNLTPLGHPVRKVINQFKPILVYVPPNSTGINEVFKDLVIGTGNEKKHHNWEQPYQEAITLLKTFGIPNCLVVDPFAGSGSFGMAAKELGMRYIGAEIEQPEKISQRI